MERRRLGRTGHESSVVTFGGAALGEVSQEQADRAIGLAVDAGVNHFDVAPSYGDAELRLAPWMPRLRGEIFLGCKTGVRDRDGALAELHRSRERLGVDTFDLYQLHAVTSMADLDEATRPGGALEALVAARDQGLTRFLGITGHELAVPRVQLEALRRFPFDTVMLPYNVQLHNDADYRRDFEALMEQVAADDVGVHILKTVAKAPWRDRDHTHATWYEPFDDAAFIDPAVAFVLGRPQVATLCAVGDVGVLPLFVAAAERYRQVPDQDTAHLVSAASAYESIFPSPG